MITALYGGLYNQINRLIEFWDSREKKEWTQRHVVYEYGILCSATWIFPKTLNCSTCNHDDFILKKKLLEFWIFEEEKDSSQQAQRRFLRDMKLNILLRYYLRYYIYSNLSHFTNGKVWYRFVLDVAFLTDLSFI